MLVHVQLCALHGVALAKGRATLFKSLGAALHSFTTWLRTMRNVEALEGAIRARLRTCIVVRPGKRPQRCADESVELVKLLCGDPEGEGHHMWRLVDGPDDTWSAARAHCYAFGSGATVFAGGFRWEAGGNYLVGAAARGPRRWAGHVRPQAKHEDRPDCYAGAPLAHWQGMGALCRESMDERRPHDSEVPSFVIKVGSRGVGVGAAFL